MATNYIKMPPIANEVKEEPKKTVFKKIVGYNPGRGTYVDNTSDTPEMWSNVMHLWKDKNYGDVFRCWDVIDGSDSTIFFGEAGDEFNQ